MFSATNTFFFVLAETNITLRTEGLANRLPKPRLLGPASIPERAWEAYSQATIRALFATQLAVSECHLELQSH